MFGFARGKEWRTEIDDEKKSRRKEICDRREQLKTLSKTDFRRLNRKAVVEVGEKWLV